MLHQHIVGQVGTDSYNGIFIRAACFLIYVEIQGSKRGIPIRWLWFSGFTVF